MPQRLRSAPAEGGLTVRSEVPFLGGGTLACVVLPDSAGDLSVATEGIAVGRFATEQDAIPCEGDRDLVGRAPVDGDVIGTRPLRCCNTADSLPDAWGREAKPRRIRLNRPRSALGT